ncbi:MAG TPA: PilT/PilU family type 4a pilus ATPase [Solirubrobacteraceae bacterium]|nr:PilT/PilU family type 4a pilus ATPase [Solirubrobacteraceae bacterium]
MFQLDQALRWIVENDGSDLHLKVKSLPLSRVHGSLHKMEDWEVLQEEDTERVVREMLAEHTDKLAEFEEDNEVDFSHAVPGLARFRVNAFRQRGTVSVVMRVIPFGVKTVQELGLPPVISEIADEERGLILLTGTTGSGKSTTLAAIIDHINETRQAHIVTIEDPIEYLHKDRNSIINQREVGMDTASFSRAMRRVLRQDPDVILIGEMRDQETVRTALSAAETGHLVLSTVHTLDAPESVNRIIDFFEPHEQNQARAMLAGTLRGVVSQRLVPTRDGTGRVAVCEILRMTGRAKDMIMDPEQTGNLREVISEGEYYGMQTFDQALLKHYQAGRVSMEDALRVATSPHDFKLLVAAEGRTATSMEDLMDASSNTAEGSSAGPSTLRSPVPVGAPAQSNGGSPPDSPSGPLPGSSSGPLPGPPSGPPSGSPLGPPSSGPPGLHN